MTRLPPALVSWERELAVFPSDLAAALGGLIARLFAAIGPFADAPAARGEPDGVGELSRRGHYERLLVSEWLLADEMPEEFLRRAADREHLFVSSAQRTPRSDRRLVVLFDAGPSQLGAPRIAHLAILLVLARRAERAGITMRWGVVQSPAAGLNGGTDTQAIARLLAARSALEPTGAHLDAWREAIGPIDLWMVGAARSLALGGERLRGSVRVEDPLAPDRHALDVVIRRDRRETSIELPLPPEPVCARLLRDPFSAASAGPARAVSHTGRIALPADGRRLVVTTEQGLASWGLPSSPRGTTGSPRQLALGRGEHLIAVGHRGRRIHAVAARKARDGTDELVFHRTPLSTTDRPFVIADPERIGAAMRGEEPLREAFVHTLGDASRPDVTFWDGAHGVVTVRADDAKPTRAWDDVLAMGVKHDGLILVRVGATETHVLEVDLARRTMKTLRVLPYRAEAAKMIGARGPASAGAVSLQRDAATYDIMSLRADGAPVTLHLPAGTRALGPCDERSMVIVDEDARSISVVARSSAHIAARASGPIVQAVRATHGTFVAWLTHEGWVEVGSLRHEGLLMRLPPEGG